MKKKRNNKRLIWGAILMGYGIYSCTSAIGFQDISDLAVGVSVGQGSVFVIWGLKELVEYIIKRGK